MIDRLIKSGKLDVAPIRGKWESFLIVRVSHPLPGLDDALVLAGSDRRGTAYGVFELSGAIAGKRFRAWGDQAMP